METSSVEFRGVFDFDWVASSSPTSMLVSSMFVGSLVWEELIVCGVLRVKRRVDFVCTRKNSTTAYRLYHTRGGLTFSYSVSSNWSVREEKNLSSRWALYKRIKEIREPREGGSILWAAASGTKIRHSVAIFYFPVRGLAQSEMQHGLISSSKSAPLRLVQTQILTLFCYIWDQI